MELYIYVCVCVCVRACVRACVRVSRTRNPSGQFTIRLYCTRRKNKTKPCNNHKSQVLPTNIKLHIYTIKDRDIFTIDQSKHLELMSIDHTIKYLNRKFKHVLPNSAIQSTYSKTSDNFMTIIKH